VASPSHPSGHAGPLRAPPDLVAGRRCRATFKSPVSHPLDVVVSFQCKVVFMALPNKCVVPRGCSPRRPLGRRPRCLGHRVRRPRPCLRTLWAELCPRPYGLAQPRAALQLGHEATVGQGRGRPHGHFRPKCQGFILIPFSITDFTQFSSNFQNL
jgi:hypothetical protein